MKRGCFAIHRENHRPPQAPPPPPPPPPKKKHCFKSDMEVETFQTVMDHKEDKLIEIQNAIYLQF